MCFFNAHLQSYHFSLDTRESYLTELTWVSHSFTMTQHCQTHHSQCPHSLLTWLLTGTHIKMPQIHGISSIYGITNHFKLYVYNIHILFFPTCHIVVCNDNTHRTPVHIFKRFEHFCFQHTGTGLYTDKCPDNTQF